MLSFIWLLRDHPWSPPALWILIRNVSHSLENVSNVIHFSDIWSRFFRKWKFSQDFGKTNLSYDLQRSLIGAFGGLLLCSCCNIPYKLLNSPPTPPTKEKYHQTAWTAVNALRWSQTLQMIRDIHNQKTFNSRNLPIWGIFQFPNRRI